MLKVTPVISAQPVVWTMLGYPFDAAPMLGAWSVCFAVRLVRLRLNLNGTPATPRPKAVSVIVTAIAMLFTTGWLVLQRPSPFFALLSGAGFGALGGGIITLSLAWIRRLQPFSEIDPDMTCKQPRSGTDKEEPNHRSRHRSQLGWRVCAAQGSSTLRMGRWAHASRVAKRKKADVGISLAGAQRPYSAAGPSFLTIAMPLEALVSCHSNLGRKLASSRPHATARSAVMKRTLPFSDDLVLAWPAQLGSVPVHPEQQSQKRLPHQPCVPDLSSEQRPCVSLSRSAPPSGSQASG
jgi:hypothetical protein